MTGSPAAVGAVCALGSALTWTLISLLVRALSPYLNTIAINVLRSALGGLLLSVIVLVWAGSGPLRGLTPGAFAYLAASTVLAFGLGDSMFFESTKHLGIARALTISMTYPLIAAGLAVLFLDEPLTVQLGGGAVVTLTGLAMVVGEHARPAPVEARPGTRGIGLALLAAVAWAAGALLMKPPLGEIDPFTAQAVRLPLAAAVLWVTPWARGTGRHLRAHVRVAGPLVAALAVLTAASSVMFVAGVKYAGVGITTVLSSTAPLFALPIGLLAFGEPVTWRAASGAALSVVGIAMLTA